MFETLGRTSYFGNYFSPWMAWTGRTKCKYYATPAISVNSLTPLNKNFIKSNQQTVRMNTCILSYSLMNAMWGDCIISNTSLHYTDHRPTHHWLLNWNSSYSNFLKISWLTQTSVHLKPMVKSNQTCRGSSVDFACGRLYVWIIFSRVSLVLYWRHSTL